MRWIDSLPWGKTHKASELRHYKHICASATHHSLKLSTPFSERRLNFSHFLLISGVFSASPRAFSVANGILMDDVKQHVYSWIRFRRIEEKSYPCPVPVSSSILGIDIDRYIQILSSIVETLGRNTVQENGGMMSKPCACRTRAKISNMCYTSHITQTNLRGTFDGCEEFRQRPLIS